MADQKIRIGVMGCAAIAERSMIPAIKNLPFHFELVAVASRTKEKADSFAKLFNCEAIVGYEKLLERDDIDAIYMPLPSGLLHEWIPRSLSSGKHVYAEKSIALTTTHCKKMIQTASENDRTLMEGFMFQYHSQHDKVKQLLAQNEIGELRFFSASFGFPPLSKDNFRYNPNLGGGALFDAGAYPVRATYFLLGDQMQISGASLKRIGSDSAALFGSAYFHGPNGLGATVSFGFDNYYQCNYTFWGSTGKLTADRAFTPKPDMSTKIILENQEGTSIFEVTAENHFEKSMLEFYKAIHDPITRERHFKEIMQQSNALDLINRLG
jgi:dTDP-3,4-didehydro-2,6-dideoxy-alpha-D-glucose 3-reductase